MGNWLIAAWVVLLIATLIYQWQLYQSKRFRLAYAAFRILFLISLLLFFLKSSPGSLVVANQHLFVLVDTSKSMQSQLGDFTQTAKLEDVLPPRIHHAIENHYSEYQQHYFDLHHPEQSENITLPKKWTLESPILKRILQFIEKAAPPKNSRILLISDGNDTEFPSIPPTFESKIKQTGIPIDTLVFSSFAHDEDVAIHFVQNPRVVFSKRANTLQVTLYSNLQKSQTTNLILTDGQSILDKKSLDLPAGEHSTQTELAWTPIERGSYLLFLRLAPVKQDQNLHNNIAYIPVIVRPHKTKVLHIAGRPSWDVRQVRSFLKSVPALDLISFYILRDPYRDAQTVPQSELALIQFPVKELFQKELFKFDIVIFHNFSIQAYLFNPEYQQSFQKYLTSGKRIIVIGGEQAIAQTKYQQLFLKESAEHFPLQFYNFVPFFPQTSERLSSDYLRLHPSFQSVHEEDSLPTEPLIRRTYSGLGQVDWVMTPLLWRKKYIQQENLLGQPGNFAAFWHTILYQTEYEKMNVFRDFQQSLPYTTANSVKGFLYLPSQKNITVKSLHLQVLDQLLNVVVWDDTLSVQKNRVHLQLPNLSPSFYKMELSCNCPEMPAVTQMLTIVDDWLELRTAKPRLDWLQQLAEMTNGQTIDI
ncbi:MAG: VWA domain-containing protein [SAR324 cluster bacterium]|nr:VWA domain-containing protein [SAR324 cluster bacterium]